MVLAFLRPWASRETQLDAEQFAHMVENGEGLFVSSGLAEDDLVKQIQNEAAKYREQQIGQIYQPTSGSDDTARCRDEAGWIGTVYKLVGVYGTSFASSNAKVFLFDEPRHAVEFARGQRTEVTCIMSTAPDLEESFVDIVSFRDDVWVWGTSTSGLVGDPEQVMIQYANVVVLAKDGHSWEQWTTMAGLVRGMIDASAER
jgi:hypothetical protein